MCTQSKKGRTRGNNPPPKPLPSLTEPSPINNTSSQNDDHGDMSCRVEPVMSPLKHINKGKMRPTSYKHFIVNHVRNISAEIKKQDNLVVGFWGVSSPGHKACKRGICWVVRFKGISIYSSWWSSLETFQAYLGGDKYYYLTWSSSPPPPLSPDMTPNSIREV